MVYEHARDGVRNVQVTFARALSELFLLDT